jgi:hypothetical protein
MAAPHHVSAGCLVALIAQGWRLHGRTLPPRGVVAAHWLGAYQVVVLRAGQRHSGAGGDMSSSEGAGSVTLSGSLQGPRWQQAVQWTVLALVRRVAAAHVAARRLAAAPVAADGMAVAALMLPAGSTAGGSKLNHGC